MATETADSLLPYWISSALPPLVLVASPPNSEVAGKCMGLDRVAVAATTVTPVSDEPPLSSSAPLSCPFRA